MLVIDYNCADENLHDRPITLSYSETQNGPWVPLATSLKNTGIYLWKADGNLPENIFLRMGSGRQSGQRWPRRNDTSDQCAGTFTARSDPRLPTDRESRVMQNAAHHCAAIVCVTKLTQDQLASGR